MPSTPLLVSIMVVGLMFPWQRFSPVLTAITQEMTTTDTPKKLQKHLRDLVRDEWTFLDEPWPMYPKTKTHHRSEFKPITGIAHMKETVLTALGAMAVFFFLTVLWSKVYFPGPYKALEKGIAFLYYFVAGESMESMSVFL